MKRTAFKLASLALAIICLFSLVACGDAAQATRDDGVLSIVCTSLAGYDLARQVAGDVENVTVTYLGADGRDMHSYEPSAKDMTVIGRADLVICLGGAVEKWLDATLSSAMNPDVRRVEMMAVCETIAHEEHEHTDDGACGLIGADEHVWLSPLNAMAITEAIGDALCGLDAPNAASYTAASEAYRAELQVLWGDYQVMVAASPHKTILIADRYPFAYLVRDLGLTCHAAFPGCSSETSASFATQTFLIDKAKELDLAYIFVIEGSDGKVAEVVADAVGAEVLTLDSMQLAGSGKSYLTIMRENLENLKKALE